MGPRETLNQMSVQNPVRPKGGIGNLNSIKRGNASLMTWRTALYWGSAAMLVFSICRIGIELFEVWGDLQ